MVENLTEEQENLILNHMKSADKIAKLLVFKGRYFVDYDELKSDAYLGLVIAARRFDNKKGLKFTTFASPHIFGSCMDGIRRAMALDGWTRSNRGYTWKYKKESLGLTDFIGLERNIVIDDPSYKEIERCDLINKVLNTEKIPRRKRMMERIFEGENSREIADSYFVSESVMTEQKRRFISNVRKHLS